MISTLETSVQSLKKDNEVQRNKLADQISINEKLDAQYKITKNNYDTKFDECLSLKSQIAHQFSYTEQNDLSNINISKTNPERPSSKPSALLLGTSNIKGINPEKLSSKTCVTKKVAFTLAETEDAVKSYTSKPDVVVLHSLTNDVKTLPPEECVTKLDDVVQLITSKWSGTKTIISLTTPRNDNEIHRINSELVDALLKKKYLSHTDVLISDNQNLWRSSPDRVLAKDKLHLSTDGTSILASNLKRFLHRILGINPEPRGNANYPPSRYTHVQGQHRRDTWYYQHSRKNAQY